MTPRPADPPAVSSHPTPTCLPPPPPPRPASQVLRSQQADLEDYLGQVRASESDLEARLRAASSAADAAEAARCAADAAAGALRGRVDVLEAEKRVLTDS
eukprot:366353-Chlamydomonas_euryale.AAC.10